MAATLHTLAELLTEAAAPADLEAVVQHGESGEWDLAFPDGRIVEATFLADSGVLVLETEVGVPAGDDLAAMHKLLLQYNYLWRETGGVRAAIDAPAGSVHLAYTLAAEGADATLLANVLANFHAAASAWAERLANPGGGMDPMASGMFAGGMRV